MLKLPPLSRYSSRSEWENACWQKLLGSRTVLGSLVTAHERRKLIIRAAVQEGLTSGKRFRHVAREIGASLQTVSSIKKALRESVYRSYWERGKTERKKKNYSVSKATSAKKSRGRRIRTKYGTLYIR